MISDAERGSLEAYLSAELPEGGPWRIARLDRLAVGQSRAMYRLELEGEPSRRVVMLRVEQWGLLGTDSADEVRAMRALRAAGYPVAEVLAYDPSTDVLAQPFFVMDFVEGSTAATPESLDAYVGSLLDLHGMDPVAAGLGFLGQPEGARDSARMQVERWYDTYRWGLVGDSSPLVEEAAEWLRQNAPETARPALVHGDPGPGNYLHRDGQLAAVVDWEFVHIGDPEEDWAYLITLRGASVMDEAAWLAYLEKVAGVRMEPERLRYWKALNFFKSVCIDQTAIKLYVEGINPAPNMLAIGTAIHLSTLQRLVRLID